jgi:hypothetical protein
MTMSTSQSAAAMGFGDLGGWRLSPGLVFGPTWQGDEPAYIHGGVELSVVHFSDRTGIWYGGYADALYSADHSRLSVGPELGWGYVGIDSGLLVRDDGSMGFAVRPLLTVAVVSGYYRHGRYFDSDSGFHEAGVLLKWPLRLTHDE